MPVSRGSSQPGDPTRVSGIAGRFFTVWVRVAAFGFDFSVTGVFVSVCVCVCVWERERERENMCAHAHIHAMPTGRTGLSVLGDMEWDTFRGEVTWSAPLTFNSCWHREPCPGLGEKGTPTCTGSGGSWTTCCMRSLWWCLDSSS